MMHCLIHSRQTKALCKVFVILSLLGCILCSPAEEITYPGATWEQITSPESVGWSSAELDIAENYADSINTAALMVVYDGRVLYQWGETSRKFMCHSIRKSFLSALYGIHVDEGNIDLNKTIDVILHRVFRGNYLHACIVQFR